MFQGQFTSEMASQALSFRAASDEEVQLGLKKEEMQKFGSVQDFSLMDSELGSAGEFPSDISFR